MHISLHIYTYILPFLTKSLSTVTYYLFSKRFKTYCLYLNISKILLLKDM